MSRRLNYRFRPFMTLDDDSLNSRSRSSSNIVEEDESRRDHNQNYKLAILPDLYCAIVVAGFGGVKMKRKGRIILVHPFFLLVCCLPLFLMQHSMLAILRLDISIDDTKSGLFHFKHVATKLSDLQAQEHTLLNMQLLQIITVQTMMFAEIATTGRLFLFLCNPTTWTDFDRPATSSQARRISYHGVAIFSCCILGIFMKATVVCQVCEDSLSIIMECRTPTDAIYNSLVLAFVPELGNALWKTLVLLLFDGVDRSEFGDFSFVKNEHNERNRRSMIPLYASSSLVKHFIERISHWKHQRSIVIEICCGFFYLRELFIVLRALDTGVLQSSRDVCLFWRIAHRKEHFLFFPAFLFRNLFFPLLRADAELDAASTECEHECYDPFHWMEIKSLFEKYQAIVVTFVLLYASMVIFSMICLYFASNDYNAAEQHQKEEHDDESQNVKHTFAMLEKRIADLERNAKQGVK